jgi:hypothetical protein
MDKTNNYPHLTSSTNPFLLKSVKCKTGGLFKLPGIFVL